jgi:uncharacterized membrane protein
MRGIVVFITGLFTISAIVLVMGAVLEPLTTVVTGSGAVQSLGWASKATSIRDMILNRIVLVFLIFLVLWPTLWYIRKNRNTGVRRR